MVPQLCWPVTSRGSKGKQESWHDTYGRRPQRQKFSWPLHLNFKVNYRKIQITMNKNQLKRKKKTSLSSYGIKTLNVSVSQHFILNSYLILDEYACISMDGYWNQQHDQINQPLEIGTSYTVKIVKQMYWHKLGVSREGGGPGWDQEMGMRKASFYCWSQENN